jgi:hypothetical protein
MNFVRAKAHKQHTFASTEKTAKGFYQQATKSTTKIFGLLLIAQSLRASNTMITPENRQADGSYRYSGKLYTHKIGN